MTKDDRSFLIEFLARQGQELSPEEARWERILLEQQDELEQARNQGAEAEAFLRRRIAELEDRLHQTKLRREAVQTARRVHLERTTQIRGFLAGTGLALLTTPLLAWVAVNSWRLLLWVSRLLDVSPQCLASGLAVTAIGLLLLRSVKEVTNWWMNRTPDFKDEVDEDDDIWDD